MTPKLVATLLRESTPAFSGHASMLLAEAHPATLEVFGTDSHRRWRQHFAQRCLELASSLDTGEDVVFVDQACWLRDAFSARGVDSEHLISSFEVLGEALRADLPEEGLTEPMRLIDAAIHGVKSGAGRHREQTLSEDALRYLESALTGDRFAATHQVLELLDGGASLREVYEGVVLPAQSQVGTMWHLGELSVSEEHLATETARTVMSVASHRMVWPKHRTRGLVLVAVVEGDTHDIGARATVDLLCDAGFDGVGLGGDVPIDEIGEAVKAFEPKGLVLSASLSLRLHQVRASVQAARRASSALAVVVGGAAFLESDRLMDEVQADALARSPGEAADLMGELLKV